jgi:leukotriene-A4 hydrolase
MCLRFYVDLSHSKQCAGTSPPLDEIVPIDGKPRVYTFDQPIKITSYLIAIVAGEIAFRSMGERTGVWADPKTVDAAEWEFKRDTERFGSSCWNNSIFALIYAWPNTDSLRLPRSC